MKESHFLNSQIHTSTVMYYYPILLHGKASQAATLLSVLKSKEDHYSSNTKEWLSVSQQTNKIQGDPTPKFAGLHSLQLVIWCNENQFSSSNQIGDLSNCLIPHSFLLCLPFSSCFSKQTKLDTMTIAKLDN